MKQLEEVVYLISRDPDRLSTPLLSIGLDVICFRSIATFLQYSRSAAAICLLVDANVADGNEPELAHCASEASPPVICVCDHLDIRGAIRAMKAGALDVLTNPVDPATLQDAVRIAFCEDRKRRVRNRALEDLRVKCSSLSPRERQVLPLIVGGMLNKQAAANLGIAEVTLQVHRAQIMKKMAAATFADLVRMAERMRLSFGGELKDDAPSAALSASLTDNRGDSWYGPTYVA